MKDTLRPGESRTSRITIDRDRTIAFMGEAARVCRGYRPELHRQEPHSLLPGRYQPPESTVSERGVACAQVIPGSRQLPFPQMDRGQAAVLE